VLEAVLGRLTDTGLLRAARRTAARLPLRPRRPLRRQARIRLDRVQGPPDRGLRAGPAAPDPQRGDHRRDRGRRRDDPGHPPAAGRPRADARRARGRRRLRQRRPHPRRPRRPRDHPARAGRGRHHPGQPQRHRAGAAPAAGRLHHRLGRPEGHLPPGSGQHQLVRPAQAQRHPRRPGPLRARRLRRVPAAAPSAPRRRTASGDAA